MFKLGVSFLVVAAVLAAAACSARDADPFDQLPQSVAAIELDYDLRQGLQAHDWAMKAASGIGAESTLTSATAFTAPGPDEFQAYVVRVVGVEADRFIDAVIDALGYTSGTSWPETIGGRQVVRAVPLGTSERRFAAYVYGFDDTVVLLLTRRPEHAAAYLAELP